MINQNAIFFNRELNSQDEVFHFLSKKAIELSIATNEEAVYKGFIEREQQGTTGMMDGFAIPHTKSMEILTPSIIIVRLEKSLDWNSMDGKPTSFIISLLIPDNEAGTTHLKILASIARMLMKADIKESLLLATSEQEIEDILNNYLKQ